MAGQDGTGDAARRVLTWQGAQAALGRAEQEAARLKIPVCVAVADRYGWLLAFGRFGDAPLISIQLSQDKAFSVAAFAGRPTHEWAEALEGDPVLTASLANTGRFSIIGGGVPIIRGRHVVGAVGVSGGTVEQDRQIAEACARAELPAAAATLSAPALPDARSRPN
ncbi:heme-binding protein [Arthrobacter sp. I2-34]|uniref:Heme-binding protein n=1 Tax=Arthrobacter hankyongi TaxID=2904801 RepID=A0ABS9LD45_9MICC|nr:heme-binding protein [Arthrobacter hankyongi]MCG2624423.1 heme-binding protein [Arthrobacter hankyongi]